MKGENPTKYHICIDNGDGTGSWKLDKTKFSKIFKYFLYNRNKLPYIIKTINYLKVYCKYIPIKFLQNLIKLNDINKKITYITLVTSLLLIIISENSSVLQNIIISILAAAIFNIFINIIPTEFNKYKKSIKIGKVVGLLSELKNSQYIDIGYLLNPWDNENMFMKKQDISMHKDKALILLQKIQEKIIHKPEIVLNEIKKDFNLTRKQINVEYFNYAHNILKSEIKRLLELDFSGLFQVFYNSLVELNEQMDRNFFVNNGEYKFNNNYEISHYITEHFTMIEYIEVLYTKECIEYSNVYFGYLNYNLKYDKKFEYDAINTHVGYYF